MVCDEDMSGDITGEIQHRSILVRRRRAVLAALAVTLAVATWALPGPSLAHAAEPSLMCRTPVSPLRAVRLADIPAQPWHAGHRGVDLAAASASTVRAPAAGVISFSGVVVDRPVLSIRHANGFVSSVEPVTGTVAVGSVVRQGQAVGTVANVSGHCAPAVCVHWGLRLNGAYVDPINYLAGFGAVQLLPLDGV